MAIQREQRSLGLCKSRALTTFPQAGPHDPPEESKSHLKLQDPFWMLESNWSDLSTPCPPDKKIYKGRAEAVLSGG